MIAEPLASNAAPSARPIRLALVGNPNCGKTALFNALTGSRQKVANYAGVTVERKEGRLSLPGGQSVQLLDLPGTYSLRARSPDEEIARDVVLGRHAVDPAPDLLICVADATHPRLCLRLALELKALGRPMVLVLNMADIARRRGIDVDTAYLAAELGVPVVSAVAVRRNGTAALVEELAARIADLPDQVRVSDWQPPERADIRALQKRADALIARAFKTPPITSSATTRIDRVLLHPIYGLAILSIVLFLMFQGVFFWAQVPMDLIKATFEALGQMAGNALPDGMMRSFVRDGLISGVGAVVVYLPQIMILFLFILFLEDFGYMARAAFLMDHLMSGAGLHGRAFIPLLSSFACAIPGIMAARVIDGRRDRLTTILIAPLVTCSARIPVYTLIISAFVPNQTVLGGFSLQGLVLFGLYLAGILSALAVSAVIKRFIWRGSVHDPFILELPDYKWPDAANLFFGVFQRAAAFLKRAGTTILAMMIVIWALASLPRPPDNATKPPIAYSFAARIGEAAAPVFAPIGFNWQITVALIPGLAAREVAVAALGTVYAIEDNMVAKPTEDQPSGEENAALTRTLADKWSLATALSFLAWYVFAPQCAATLATIRRETGSAVFALISFGYMFALAYAAALATYQGASALGLG